MKSDPLVAIVGIGLRFPGGVGNPHELVDFLRAHGDGVRDVPPDRWSTDLHYHPDPNAPGKAYVKAGGFLRQDVYAFDPEPFGISPREADRLDPQQRLLLETAWEAFEDAGLALEALRGSDTAVFIGGFTQDHQNLAYLPDNRGLIDAHTSVGASMTVLSNRLSYTFDLRGPSVTVDTACSSSLVAAHFGYEAIVRGGATMAIVGGVNVMLSPASTVAMCKGHFLAPDGRSKSFEASADGYGRGEGAAVVILKALERAIADGDRVYAVLRAIGVNQDGRTPGMPVPNEEAQRALCRAVLDRSGLTASDICYVEAHGTGTRVGDPIETRALGAVYGAGRAEPLSIGSIKTNIGHLEAAAGIAGLIKSALTVHHREVFPIRAFGAPNPEIPFERLRLSVATRGRELPSETPAHVAVNAFGYGGTNAHAIVSAWPAGPGEGDDSSPDPPPPRLVPLSAACGAALRQRARDLSEVVNAELFSAQAFTLARRRSHLAERAALLCGSAPELTAELRALAEGQASSRRVTGTAHAERRLVWVFTGMGPQWWGMGQELYRSEPAFRAMADAADAAFRSIAGWSVLEQMLKAESESSMRSNAVAQPANFVLQTSLVSLLRSLGVPAGAYLGHSVGEVTAAWASGCLTLAEAASLAYHRSRIQQGAAGKGTMLAVGLSADEAVELLAEVEDVAIAAYNSPRQVTLSGGRAPLEHLVTRLEARGVFHRFVPVEVAYHSPHMDGLEWEFRSALSGLRPAAPTQPLYSTAHGNRVTSPVHDAEYWWENARKPVLLAQAVETAMSDGFTAFLEIGPHPVLASAIQELSAEQRRDCKTFFCLKRKEPERASIDRALAQLYVNGVALDWSRLYPAGRMVALPRYPFQRRHHWAESRAAADARLGRTASLPFFSERDPGPTPRFVADLGRPAFEYLEDHRIQGLSVFPGAGYVEAALAACVELAPDDGEIVLERLTFERTLVLKKSEPIKLVLDMVENDGDFSIYGAGGAGVWQRHARGRWQRSARYRAPSLVEGMPPSPDAEEVSVEGLYDRFREMGLEYGTRFRRLGRVWLGPSRAGGDRRIVARLTAEPHEAGTSTLPPPFLDGAFQALLALVVDTARALVPVEIDWLRYDAHAGAPVWVVGHAFVDEDGSLAGELKLADESGRVKLELRGLVCRALDPRAVDPDAELGRWLYASSWLARGLPESPSGVADEAPARGPWLLVGSATAFLATLAERLKAVGVDAQACVDADDATSHVEHIVFAHASAEDDPAGIAGVESLLTAVRAATRAGTRLTLLTFDAARVLPEDCPRPAQSALCGFARVVMTEHPELRCRIIDLDARDAEAALTALTRILRDDALEEETALRSGALYAHRLRRDAPPPRDVEQSPASDPSVQAAPTPGDYFRAWYALSRAAALTTGDSALILNAEGPLGRACSHVAKALGVQLYATHSDGDAAGAGMSGVQRVFSCDTLDFIDEVRADTGGKGVDAVVLLSGTRAALDSMRALNSHGRFVSLAPFDHAGKLDLRMLRAGISVTALDFEGLVSDRPEPALRVAREVVAAFAVGALPSGEAGTIPDDPAAVLLDAIAPRTATSGAARFRADRSYLVTGGLTGLGLATAEWLARHGARAIVLASRRGRPEGQAQSRIDALRARGVRVECRSLDVSDPESIDALLASVVSEVPELGGIFHSAMVLEDAPIRRLDDASLRAVMRPKALGALLLHEKTLGLALDHFVLYSSVSALIGNPNQGAYAAANAFLDGLAAARRAQGKPALSVSFGAIQDAGVVARDRALRGHLENLGISPMLAPRALALLADHLTSDSPDLGIYDMRWERWVANFPETPWNRLSGLLAERSSEDPLTTLRVELLEMPEDDRNLAVAERTRRAVALVLDLAEERLNEASLLQALGLDSLMAVELQVALERATGVTVPSIELLAGGTLGELSARILQRLIPKVPTPSVSAPEAEDLRTLFLSRICVTPPYFDLMELSTAGEWVEAWVTPVAPSDAELDTVSCAETARHLAIVGSCAVSQRCPAPGKVYYPVLRAEYPGAEGPMPTMESYDRVRVRARCAEFDARASRATAETELLAPDGTLLRRLRVEYHVIPEVEFQKLFEAHARDTAEDSGEDPYASHRALPTVDECAGAYHASLGPVDAADCLGHFRGYPALPVSIMVRHAVELVAAALRKRRAREDVSVTVVAGTAETYSFAFAGEPVTLETRLLDANDADIQAVRCDVRSGARAVASFQLRVVVQQPRESGIRLAAAGGITAVAGTRAAG